MRVAICGTRGIPACYGGFETFAEELSQRLVERGHEVTVYGRSHLIDWKEPFYKGVRIRLLPAPRHKYLETPVNTFYSFLNLLKHRVDVVLVCNAANSPFLWIPRIAGMPVLVNVDGVERRRAKWNVAGRIWYLVGEISSVLLASGIIADAEVIHDYYKRVYRKESVVIRYGYCNAREELASAKIAGELGQISDFSGEKLFGELGVRADNYLLYVSRLEPENNAHLVIEAYNELSAELRNRMPLVVVGDAPYAKNYKCSLRDLGGKNVIFVGYRFGEDYYKLQWGAHIYLQATEVGGTHPALVEAMGFGNCIIANETPEHREVLADCGCYFEKNSAESLSACLKVLLSCREDVLRYRQLARARAIVEFSWKQIANDYEQLFRKYLKS